MNRDRVIELECNVDDMTAEEIAFAMERLMDAGAKDVFATPLVMKKSRPGMMLTVMTTEDRREEMLELIFRYTSTIGIREMVFERYILDRTEVEVDTAYGKVRRKDVSGYGASRSKYEYEDLARIARENGLSIGEVRKEIEKQRQDPEWDPDKEDENGSYDQR